MSSPFSLTLTNPSSGLSFAAEFLSPIRFVALLVWPLALIAGGAGYADFYELRANLDLILRTFSFFQNLIISMLTANLLSRLAMGITMARHSIPPQEFGIRLIYGVLPRFFVSTGPIRRLDFPEQRHCYATPLLTRLALFAIGTLGWAILRRGGTGIADALLVLGATGLGSFLFTLNPIWRADGYHWMAAYFRRPDLREQSYRLLGLILRRKPIPESMPRREIYALLFYAVASIVFTAFLVVVILSSIAFALEQQFRGTGVVIFALILSMGFAFVLSKSGKGKNKSRRKKRKQRSPTPPAPAKLSPDEKLSCYRLAQDDNQLTNSGRIEHMARTTSQKPTDEPKPSSAPAEVEDLDALLSEEISDDQPAETSKPDLDAALDDLLGPPPSASVKAPPADEFDEILEAALGPVTPAQRQKSREETAKEDEGVPHDHSLVVDPRPSSLVERKNAPPPAPPNDLDRVLKMGAHARKPRSRGRMLLIWAIVLVVGYVIAIQPYPFTVGGDFIIQSSARTEVRARTNGEIISLNVTEGDWVDDDGVMAVLSNWDEMRDVAIQEADLARLKADFETLVAGPKPEEIALAEQLVSAAETRLAQAKQDLDRKEQLFASNTISRKTLDDAISAHILAVSERDQAQTQLALLKAPTLDSEINSAKASIARQEQELAFSRLQLEHTNIRATLSGRVVSTMDEIAVGTFMREGDLFAELADDRVVLAEIEVPETDIDEAVIGAQVTLKLWSAPDEEIFGTVKRVAPVAEEREFGRVVRVVLEVPNPDGRLVQNMTGYGKVIVDERPVWEVFTRVIIRFFQVELWSWLP
ncbi:HlyD family secretion protein [Celeribacter litoreus]|uniref:HlyD family secretion protein n=1 Tax=Celeribacter litoreus TaxID=2876714 RepID=UPI001CCDA09F|nr:efflux RND transporter periplasmic adaptor subunit [Celeribacter litoreus]MCA0045084.1 efflux RND transporter periplasmic adaptor subunit [Celeribacter litoreus]